MSRNIDPHRALLDPYAQTADVLAWSDEQSEQDYLERISHLEQCQAKIKRTKTPQAVYSRARFTAELARLSALLGDADRSVEVERAAYLAAAQAVDAADASAYTATEAGDVDALLRARAERDIAAHRSNACRAAFVAAALSRKLPSLGVEFGPTVHVNARRDTADLARHADAVSAIDDELGARQTEAARQAADVALAHGRTGSARVATYWAVAEAEYDQPTETGARKLFEARWCTAARVLGVEQPAAIDWRATAAE
jgi:hypothetical protein